MLKLVCLNLWEKTVKQGLTSLYFIGLIPPTPIREEITGIKEYVADKFHSRAALRSPPHITFQPPFRWEINRQNILGGALVGFFKKYEPFETNLSGFGAFSPRVIYINVENNSPMETLHTRLREFCHQEFGINNQGEGPFRPHLTIAFRDLTKQQFRLAWEEFQNREFQFRFEAQGLSLLRHDGKIWEANQELQFGNS